MFLKLASENIIQKIATSMKILKSNNLYFFMSLVFKLIFDDCLILIYRLPVQRDNLGISSFHIFLNFSIKSGYLFNNLFIFKNSHWGETKLPECGVSVEMANHFFTLLDFLKKVSLTRDFSVFPMSFWKPFLIWRKEKYHTFEISFNVTLYLISKSLYYFVIKLTLS